MISFYPHMCDIIFDQSVCDTNEQLAVSLRSKLQTLVFEIKEQSILLKRNFVSPRAHVISSIKNYIYILLSDETTSGDSMRCVCFFT